jgi:hypothetical protein
VWGSGNRCYSPSRGSETRRSPSDVLTVTTSDVPRGITAAKALFWSGAGTSPTRTAMTMSATMPVTTKRLWLGRPFAPPQPEVNCTMAPLSVNLIGGPCRRRHLACQRTGQTTRHRRLSRCTRADHRQPARDGPTKDQRGHPTVPRSLADHHLLADGQELTHAHQAADRLPSWHDSFTAPRPARPPRSAARRCQRMRRGGSPRYSATTRISPTMASLNSSSSSAGIQYSRCSRPPASCGSYRDRYGPSTSKVVT